MLLDINVHLRYSVQHTTDLLLQIEASELPDQKIVEASIELSPTEHFARVPAENGIGERIWLRVDREFRCNYRARMSITRPPLDISQMPSVSPHRLPGDTVRYLMPSRYCPSDEFQSFVNAEFSQYQGGARIAAFRTWIEKKFQYAPGSSTSQTTALDTFVQRRGICRDFAHVLITLARASGIPARFVSVFAPGITPPDFHAVAEVYLEDGWHLVDPTGMARTETMARIGVGLDAADVAFLTSFGFMDMLEQSVSVFRA
ncbi:MAG: transglutaminase-like putative cysteine protease [Paracoccaceae bacterium]|jgi:transglutaminase-like putative cysteine protease